MTRSVRWRRTFATAMAVAIGTTAGPVQAQQASGVGSIEGVVRETGTGRPVEGAQVGVTGTGVGAVTNSSGSYHLVNVPARSVEVRVRMVGFSPISRTVTVRAGGTVTQDFTLAQSALQLEAVVTTGTAGATEVRKLGNTVATVEVPRFAPINSPSELLQGREPGVVGLPGSGMTGGGARIRIRGTASLSQSAEPIIFVDGIRINSSGDFSTNVGDGGGGSPSRLDDIDPASIERIEILKGAAAATLYGTEASNGVIQIFTKHGTSGVARWDVNLMQEASQYFTGNLEENFGFASSQTQADFLNQFWGRNDIKPFTPFSEPLEKKLFGTGRASTVSAAVNGGTTNLTYFVSGRYYDENGPYEGPTARFGPAQDVNQKRQATLNLQAFPLATLKLGARAGYIHSYIEAPQNNNNIYSQLTQALFGRPDLVNCNGSALKSPGQCTGAGNLYGVQGAFGSPEELAHIITSQNLDRLISAVDLTYTPTTNLNFSGTFGVDYTGSNNVNFQPFLYNVDHITNNDTLGSKLSQDRWDREITIDVKGNWTHNFGSRLNSQFVAGAQGFISHVQQPGGFSHNFPGPGISVASAGEEATVYDAITETVNGGYFGQEQIGWDNWVFLTAGARYDYSSAFGTTSSGVLYPKASISIDPGSRPGWNHDRTYLSSFRVRAAIGQSGRQPSAYDKLTTFEALLGNGGSGLAPANLGNPDLKPEVATEWEAGFETGFLADKIGLEATYWNRRVSDLLVQKQYPLSGGFQDTQLSNVGEMKAYGTEIGLKAYLVQRPNVSLDLFANGAYLHQEVTSLGGSPPLKVGGSYPRYRNFIKEGWDPGHLFGAKLMPNCSASFTSNCVPAGSLPYDLNHDGAPDTEAQVRTYLSQPRSVDDLFSGGAILLENGLDSDLGKPTPNWTGSWGGNLTFLKNFRVYTLFEYKAGDYTYTCLTCGFRQASTRGRNIRPTSEAWATLANPASTVDQRFDAAKRWLSLAALSPYDGLNQNYKGDFMRMRELSLTYTAPATFAHRMKARDLSVTLTGRNLLLWTQYPGADPEINYFGRTIGGGIDSNFGDTIDAFGVPLQKRFGLSVRLGF